jgi:[ribosomal protein S18]-alanine N-acetyltransferase
MTSGAIAAVDAGALPTLATLCGALLGPEWNRDSLAKLLETPGTFACLAWPEQGGGEAAGFILVRAAGGECELLGLGVATPWRRQGWAGRLLAEGLACAAGLGAERCTLEVAEDNAAALACYRAAGFRPVGRRVNYYVRDSGAVAAIIMARDLLANSAAGLAPNMINSQGMR